MPYLDELDGQVVGRLRQETRARRRAEIALRRLQAALETMQLGVTITDSRGSIVYVNPADAQMHGYSADELIGRQVGVFSLPEDRNPLPASELAKLTTWKRESINVRKDGTTFPVQLLSDVVRDSCGRPMGVVTTCEDITERRRTEETLRTQAEERSLALEAELRHAQRLDAIGRLSAGIAHDFNNILTVMYASIANLALDLPASSPASASLRELRAAAQSGAALVSRLLNFGRKAELQRAPLDLCRVVPDVARMAQRLLPPTLRLVTTILPDALVVLADPLAIEQVLLNLVTNARDAMPSGGDIHVLLRRAERGTPSKRYACLCVGDTGVGMDEETRAQAFEPFFTTKEPGQGTGLGLAAAHGLIKQHDGETELQSELGVGTTVRIWLPEVEPA